MGRATPHQLSCGSCRRFLDGYRDVERELRGMTALSSALGSTRGAAGICEVSGRFHDPLPACSDYLARSVAVTGSDPLPDRNDTARTAARPWRAGGGHA